MKIPRWRPIGTVRANLKSPNAESDSAVALGAGYGRGTAPVGVHSARRSRTALSTARGAIGVVSTAMIAFPTCFRQRQLLKVPLVRQILKMRSASSWQMRLRQTSRSKELYLLNLDGKMMLSIREDGSGT